MLHEMTQAKYLYVTLRLVKGVALDPQQNMGPHSLYFPSVVWRPGVELAVEDGGPAVLPVGTFTYDILTTKT